LREFFFGAHRFEEIRQNLRIAPNILSDRLYHLLDNGIIDRAPYSLRPLRYEYRLTETGRDIYQPFIQMMAWGDKWLGFPAPLILSHRSCGQDFHPLVVCSNCREPVCSQSVRYQLHYPAINIGRTPPALILDKNV
jgi:DNA-binding HxlR family transcriptional regulator